MSPENFEGVKAEGRGQKAEVSFHNSFRIAIISSNAKAIEALTANISELTQEWQKDRRGIYDLLARLTRAQADFYETQSDFYRRFDE